MPRVSAEHLDRRRTQVLHAAARRFARSGFHATSMADVITESGLSAGAVYRYFAGKDQLIVAVADEAFQAAERLFDATPVGGDTPSPDEVLLRYVEVVTGSTGPGGFELGPLLLQAWAESVRSEASRARAEVVLRRVREAFAQVARRWVEDGRLPPGRDPEVVGSALLACAQGLLVQRLIIHDTPVEEIAKTVAATGLFSPNPS